MRQDDSREGFRAIWFVNGVPRPWGEAGGEQVTKYVCRASAAADRAATGKKYFAEARLSDAC